MTTQRTKPLLVTAGEPAGIGPELCASLVEHGDDVVVVGDARLLDKRLTVIDRPFPAPVTPGNPDSANAATLLDGLTFAVEACLAGDYSGLVTAPLSKKVVADSGATFTGHTEYLADLCGVARPVMLLVAGDMRVALASTHLPLSAVPEHITRDRLRQTIRTLHDDLVEKFGIDDPRIIVCGLNPHAGEGGLLGVEDDAVIAPVVDELVATGLNLVGPVPADTAFTPAAGTRDAVLAMYHDQGLPVLKYAGFGKAVNVTLGLPIIRTSVDHGTAFDLAGKGKADAGSLLAAVEIASTLATRRRQRQSDAEPTDA